MPRNSAKLTVIGIECEALEGPTWGMGRQIRKLLEGLAARKDLYDTHRFILYSNGSLPADTLYAQELFIQRPCGLKTLLGSWAPSSFSVHYYVLLPLRILWDSLRYNLRAMYYPNYMLPLIHPPHVRSLVMLTEDIFRESRNPALPFRYRLAYQIFATFWANRRADRIMAISHASADALEHLGIPRARIAINEMGVPAATSSQQTIDNRQRTDFLFVGQAFPRRHLKEALIAFEGLARTRPEATFQIIGRDKYPEPTISPLVERMNATLGRQAVTLKEYVPDEELIEAYRQARTLVYVSETEGFGMPPLEALAYGTAPVVADTPVNREIYGPHAFFVPVPITQEGIVYAMECSVTDEFTHRTIHAAAPAILARYTWSAHTERFVSIMHELIRC